MTSWCYVEPGPDGEAVFVTMTDAEIIAEYFPYWSEQMRKKFGEDESMITHAECIGDWVVVHWAWRVDEDSGDGQSEVAGCEGHRDRDPEGQA